MILYICVVNTKCICIIISLGQFGEVFKATMFKGTPAEVTVTVKTVKGTSSGMERDSFIKEMCAMSKIMHPNIVRLFGLVYGGKH